MNLSKLSIKRAVTFTMIYIMVIGFGLFGFSQLDIDLYPKLEFPMIGVITNYEGVAPQNIENLVTRPLEETVISVEGVKEVKSNSSTGTSIIFINFDWGTNMDKAEIDVREKIDFVKDYLPDEASEPMSFAFDPSMQPILFFNVSSKELSDIELREVVKEQIKPRLERLEGVASVMVNGGLEREIQVEIDPFKLAANHISINDVSNALRFANLDMPGGILEENKKEFSVVTNAKYESIEEIKNTVVSYSQYGEPIYLKHIAKVYDGFKEETKIVRNNGESAIVLIAYKRSDANTVNACENINNYLPKLKSQLGYDIEFNTIFDQSEFINNSVSNLSVTAILAFVMSFFVLFFFLRHLNSSIIVAISIPISIIFTFFIMSQIGVTLNIVSMAGLALAIGLLVDNSIVVLENIFRRRNDLSEDIRTASEKGSSEVSTAIIASTLTTVSVFVPILFVPGISGALFKDMALTIVVSLFISLMVALTLIPLLSSRFLSKKQEGHASTIGGKFDNMIGGWLDKLSIVYSKSLRWSVQHKKMVLGSILIVLIISIVSLKWIGGEFLPKTDESNIQMDIETPIGTSLSATNKIFKEVEGIIMAIPEVKNTYIDFGRAGGFSAMFGGASNKGSMNIKLINKNKRKRSQFDIEDYLRNRLDTIPNLKMSFSQGGPTTGMEGAITVKIFGHNLDKGKQIAEQVKKMMENIPGIVDTKLSFSDPKPEYYIKIDRVKAAQLGLSVFQISSTISKSIKGDIATRFREGGDEYNILVRFGNKYRESKMDLKNIFIALPTGEQIPLNSVAKIESTVGPVQISREDQSRYVSVSANNSGRDLQSITVDIESGLKNILLPEDTHIEIGGTAQDQQESFFYLGLAILVSIALVYMVMASQFESLLDPFIILFTIPLALIGVVVALFITGTNLSVTVFIGGMLLVGIVVNNGIVLIDYINQLIKKHKMEVKEAIVIGAKTRLRPVLMTAITTILSMLPLAIELGSSSEIWSPMARAIIGGLIASTFLTLFFVPIMFYVLQRKRLEVTE